MQTVYAYNRSYMHTQGGLQFAGSDLQVLASPINNACDLAVSVLRGDTTIYHVTLAGAFTLWVPRPAPMLLSQHVNLSQVQLR